MSPGLTSSGTYIDSSFNQTVVHADFDCPFSKDVTWVGSCNGIVCLAIDKINVVLWNPCIGKSKKLPDFGFDSSEYVYCVYGFGLDVSRDDYKVVVLEVNKEFIYRKRPVVIKVYSLKANCWKRIGNCDLRMKMFRGSSAYANGRFYWTAEHEVDHGNMILVEPHSDIVYFDMETEELGILKQPDCVKRFDGPINFVESEGCLYVYYRYWYPPPGEVWKVEGYGVGKEIWTKIANIALDDRVNVGSGRYVYTVFLYMGNNGEMVFACGEKLVVYNKRDYSFSHLDVGRFDGFKAGTYVESLISPLV